MHADMAIKQRALDRMTPPDVPPGRYQPPDELIVLLGEPVTMPTRSRPPPLPTRTALRHET